MIKSGKLFITVSILILAFLVSACSGSNSSKQSLDDISVGTNGIAINFLPNNPPQTVHVDPTDQQNKITAVVELKNMGVYPQVDEAKAPEGKIYLSGFDKNIIDFKTVNFYDLKTKFLDGKSLINLNGGSDIAVFDGDILADNLKVHRYEPTLMATVCYHYKTVAGPSVCIDPDPYTTVKQQKVCQVQDLTLTSQGAPVAVVGVAEQAFATKTQFKIKIKNVGLGDVLRLTGNSQKGGSSADAVEKCNPSGNDKLTRDDIDQVYLEGVKIGQQQLNCWPFADENVKASQGYIRLLNGEGSIVCELQKIDQSQGYDGGNTAYTTPLRIVLSYVYKSTAQRSILIQKEGFDSSAQ